MTHVSWMAVGMIPGFALGVMFCCYLLGRRHRDPAARLRRQQEKRLARAERIISGQRIQPNVPPPVAREVPSSPPAPPPPPPWHRPRGNDDELVDTRRDYD